MVRLAVTWVAVMLGATVARAQSQPPGPPDAAPGQSDPPAVVGRIAESKGSVSYKGAASANWVNAERNWPVVAGDAIYAAADGEAKLEIGSAAISLRAGSEVDFVTLGDRSVSLRSDLGTIEIVTASSSETVAITTIRGAASLAPDGLYRVSAGEPTGAPTEIAVCRGAASLGDGRTRLGQGQMARLSDDPANPRVEVVPAPPCGAGPAVQASRLPPKVSRSLTGIQDLAARGRWATSQGQGDIWYPDDVPADWAPYKNGHWTWVAPWGWTWIDDAPWGFAPFHYGKWTDAGGSWGWVPGDYAEVPVYAPAMVAFVDVPPDAFAYPAMGWVPLAPGEIYRPYYYSGVDYMRRVNITVPGVTVATIAAVVAAPLIVASLRNQRAALAAPISAVQGNRPVAQAATRLPANVLARIPVRPAGTAPIPRGQGPQTQVAARPVAVPPARAPVPAGLPNRGGPIGLSPPPSPNGRGPLPPAAQPAPTGPIAARPPVSTPPSAPLPARGQLPAGPAPVRAPAGPVARPSLPAGPVRVARPMPARTFQPRPVFRPIGRPAPAARPSRPVFRAPPRVAPRAAPRPAPRAAPRAAPRRAPGRPKRR